MKLFKILATGVTALALGVPMAHAADFTLTSKALQPGATISADYYWNNFGCSGANVMPDLAWKGVPAGTKSIAVTLYDKDAPTGSGFWHWVAYDIPVDTSGLPGGKNGTALPAGAIEGNTDLGKPGFFGPCPPVGRLHHYEYTVYALKVDKLPIDKGATAALVGFYLWQNTIAKTTLGVIAGPRK